MVNEQSYEVLCNGTKAHPETNIPGEVFLGIKGHGSLILQLKLTESVIDVLSKEDPEDCQISITTAANSKNHKHEEFVKKDINFGQLLQGEESIDLPSCSNGGRYYVSIISDSRRRTLGTFLVAKESFALVLLVEEVYREVEVSALQDHVSICQLIERFIMYAGLETNEKEFLKKYVEKNHISDVNLKKACRYILTNRDQL